MHVSFPHPAPKAGPAAAATEAIRTLQTVTDEIGIPRALLRADRAGPAISLHDDPAVGAAQAEVGPDEFSSDAALPLDPGGSALPGEGEEFVLSETQAPSLAGDGVHALT